MREGNALRQQRFNYDWEEAYRILNKGDDKATNRAPLPKITVDAKALPSWNMKPMPIQACRGKRRENARRSDYEC